MFLVKLAVSSSSAESAQAIQWRGADVNSASSFLSNCQLLATPLMLVGIVESGLLDAPTSM